MRDFNKDLNFGQEGEDLFEKEILPILEPIGNWSKVKDIDGQKTKGDFKGIENYYEIKTRDPSRSNFGDITQEIKHTEDDGSPDVDGYILKYGHETILVYQRTKIENGELKLKYPIFMYRPYDLRKHLKWMKRFKQRSVKNDGYTTWFICNITPEKLAQKIDFWSITKEKRIIKWK